MEILICSCTFTLSKPLAGGFPILLVQSCFVSTSTALPHKYLDMMYYTAHHGRNTSKTMKHKSTELPFSALVAEMISMISYLHKGRLGYKHAGLNGFVLVAEGDHVEADSLGYCQDEGHHPDRHNLNDCEPRDSHPLHSAPGCHSPVPVTQEKTKFTPTVWKCWYTV